MYKNLLRPLAFLIVVTFGMASCSREYHPQFASGRFHHDSKDNRTPYEAFSGSCQLDKIDPLSAKEPQDLLTASSDNDLQLLPVTESSKHLSAYSQSKINKETNIKPINEKEGTVLKTQSSSLLEPKEKSTAETTSGADSDIRLICAIVAFFIPPLGVVLYEKKITTNFWIDLILTLLFWLPGFIFALIVILS